MKIRVLVVDDSPTMRGLIAAALQRDHEIEVVGFAADPIEAREAIKRLEPDVLTLDIEMPNMNGLAFLERLMRLKPMPVVMVSTLTQAGADVTLAALELGAIDCIAKPSNGDAMREALEHLGEVVKNAARARVRPPSSKPIAAPQSEFISDGSIVAIGASTGGVEALMTVLGRFPANCPPTVVTQHMPKSFTKSFASRLDAHCAPRVSEAEDGARLMQGRVYIAPGGERHLEVVQSGGEMHCRLIEAPAVNGHRPSVDVLMHSVARITPRAVGAILTGMGKDGAVGLKAMRDKGARTIAQDEASCVVYGMPRAAFEMGAAEMQMPLSRIGDSIIELCSSKQRKVS
jgi:two-component system chemotaxis response regulator CheB